jgi:predicted outer membrane repeat protein
MNFEVRNAAELSTAIATANHQPNEAHIINLLGEDSDYVVTKAATQFFGPTAFPIVTSNISINGNGRTISRDNTLAYFRFFGVETKTTLVKVQLTLNQLILRNGDSGQMGGGAIVNNAPLFINNCVFQDNLGALGAVIYNGDGYELTVTNSHFIHNTAIEKGGAIYSAHSALKLVLSNCTFEDNYALDDGKNDIHFYGFTSVQLNNNNFSGTVWVDDEVIPEDQLEKLNITQPLPYTGPREVPSVFLNNINSEKLILLLDRFDRSKNAVIAGLAQRVKLETLHKIAVFYRQQEHDLLERATKFNAQFKIIQRALAFVPSVDAIQEVIRLFTQQNTQFDRDNPYVEMAALIASAQPPQTIIQWFENVDEFKKILEQELEHKYPTSPGVLVIDDLLVCLIQELVVRKVQCDDVPAIKQYVEKQASKPSFVKGLFGLPLRLLDIENEIPDYLYQIYPSGGESSEAVNHPFLYSGEINEDGYPQHFESSITKFKEKLVLDELELMKTVIFTWQYEVHIFEADILLEVTDVSPSLLKSLRLDSTKEAERINLLPITANFALASLFSIACNGGPYERGMRGALGRFQTWQSVAGLVGASKETLVETIAELAEQCQWFFFGTDKGWFWNYGWDIGLVVLRPDRKTLAVLAATDTD